MIFADASGLRPKASIALNPINPIANAGKIPPTAIVAPPVSANCILMTTSLFTLHSLSGGGRDCKTVNIHNMKQIISDRLLGW